MNPYEILGLPLNTEFNEVRARYFYLARTHHPDKLGSNVSEEEKKKREEYFKNITVAYHEIDKRHKNGGGAGGWEGGYGSVSEEFNLNDIWRQVEVFFNNPETWECMKEIFVKVSQTATSRQNQPSHSQPAPAPSSTPPPPPPRKHNIVVNLTLEEIHNKKNKKLRLFLKGLEKPIFVTINSADIFIDNVIEFNNYKINSIHEIDIIIHLKIQRHTTYRLLRLVDRWDIFYDMYITWDEYVNGKQVLLDYLDGEQIEINIPKFYNIDSSPIIIENRGLCQKGDLFIVLKINNPKNQEELDILFNRIQTLRCLIDPGAEEAKTI
jgi:DnaJ-class molecular chaperone